MRKIFFAFEYIRSSNETIRLVSDLEVMSSIQDFPSSNIVGRALGQLIVDVEIALQYLNNRQPPISPETKSIVVTALSKYVAKD